jgi:hypothetical protein
MSGPAEGGVICESGAGYPFVLFSVETWASRLAGTEALAFARDEAAGPRGIKRASFVAGAMRELS